MAALPIVEQTVPFEIDAWGILTLRLLYEE
jgi:hypothetical protein